MEDYYMATKLTDKYLQSFIAEHEYAGVAEEVKAMLCKE